MTQLDSYSTAARVLALCRYSGVTPRMFEALMRRFSDLNEIIEADRESLMSIDGIDDSMAQTISEAVDRLPEAATYAESLNQREIKLCTRFDTNYPKLLLELHDPPPILFIRGELPYPSRKTVTLVGAENATSDGITLTSDLAKKFTEEGVQVTSSLIGGAASAAHLATTTNGGNSFAVIDSGHDGIIGNQSITLAIDIIRNGGVISEYAPDIETSSDTRIQTNRIMVGISQAVVITEAYADSANTLDLMDVCAEIGKLVFFMVDPEKGAHADEASLARAIHNGAIIIKGYNHVDDIILSLV